MKLTLKQRYHWVIALVALLELFVHVGIVNNLVGLYVVPVSESLGITRAGFSLGFSIRSMVSAVVVILSGPVIRRYGYRYLSAAALAVTALAYINMGLSRNVYMLYCSCIVFGICDGFCSTAAAVYLVGNWFHKYRGTILGLVTAATGFGGSAFCMLITGVMEFSDWRVSLYVCAGCALFMAVVVLLAVRSEPRELGLVPLGEGEVSGKHVRKKKDEDHWHGFEMSLLLKLPGFYLALLAVLLTNLCLCLAYYNVVPYLRDCGMSASQAAAMQSVMLLVMAGFKLLCGALSDWLGARWTTSICAAFLIVSLGLFCGISGAAAAWAAVLTFSLALPLMSVMIPLFSAALFGYRAHNSFSGVFLAMPSVAAIAANPVANVIHDRVGSYRPAFLGAAVLSVLVFVLYIVVFIVTARERKREEEKAI